MKVVSFLELLEKQGKTKEFFNYVYENNVIKIIDNKNLDFSKHLSKEKFISFLGYSQTGIIDIAKMVDELDADDLVEDDVFCFAAQQKLVDLSEDENSSEDDMYKIKKFLTYHMMYQEAMIGSAYDRILRKKNEAPQHVVEQYPIVDEDDDEPILNEPNIDEQNIDEVVPYHFTQEFDEKYKNAIFKIPKKNFQKAEFYKGCKILIDGHSVSNIVYIDKWDDAKVYSEDGFDFESKKSVPVFQTLEPEVGDIVKINSDTYVLGTKEMIDLCKKNEQNNNITYYTIKYNNRKIEKKVVKRFACGTTEIDLSTIPYHVEIEFDDIKVNYDVDAIAKHYNLAHDKVERKEIELMKILKTTLDHPLNVARSEWALLVADAGAGKTSLAVQYAEEKKLEYVIMQGNAQLSQDDFIGYKSIIKSDKDLTSEDLYVRSLLRECVEHGKIFILDEMDACNPNTLICLNSLKNKKFQFPDKLVDVHPNFRFIATANTLEYNDVYNGRSKLDKATLDRFDIIDANMEEHHLAVRYGLNYIKEIKNINKKSPREVEREVTKAKIKEESAQTNNKGE